MRLSPDELAAKVEELQGFRTDTAAPFDVAVFGYSDTGGDTPRNYADAGATWWLEYFHDRRGDLDSARRRIAAGPAR
jgi:hypothetical protein